MKKLCKDCMFWEPMENKGNWIGNRNQGDCSCKSFIEYISCDAEYPVDSLVYWDAEGYASGFNTGCDFGCIHWREKA